MDLDLSSHRRRAGSLPRRRAHRASGAIWQHHCHARRGTRTHRPPRPGTDPDSGGDREKALRPSFRLISHNPRNVGEGDSSTPQSDFSVSVFQCFSFFFCHAPFRLHPILLKNQSLIPLTFSFPLGILILTLFPLPHPSSPKFPFPFPMR